MSLAILKTGYWKLIFQKNKIVEELPKRTEKFNEIKLKIGEAIDIQSNGGWKLTEEEQKIQDEFLPKLFKKMIRKKELPEKPQITRLVPRNETEAVEMLKKINNRFPEIIKNFMKSNSEVKEQDEEINKMYKEIKEMYSEIREMCRETKDTNEKKEKIGIFDIIHPLTKEEYKRLPSTFRDLFEKFWVNKIYKLPRKIRSEEIKVYFLETLKRFRRYAPRYKEKNKQDIDNMLARMLKKPDLQEEKEIIDIIKECRELIKTEKKS